MTDILDDPNAAVKGAIAQRREEEQQQQQQSGLTVTKILAKRLESVFQKEVRDKQGNVIKTQPDVVKINQFVGRLTVLREENPAISKCTPASVLDCMIACANLDLLPNTSQQFAYLIPYGSKLQFQLGYKGLIELASRSGLVKRIDAKLVFPQDTFDYEEGLDPYLKHKPDLSVDRTDYSKLKAVYAYAVLENGEKPFMVMNMGEIDKIRKTSKAANGGDNPWAKWPERMAMKTVIKQLLKYLPSSTVDNRFKEGIEYDDRAEGGKLHFNEDNTLDLNAEVDYAEAAERPKDKGIQNFAAQAREAAAQEGEVVEEAAPADDGSQVDPTADMSDDDLREAITEMLDFLKLTKPQEAKVYDLIGSSDLALADRVGLTKGFVKLDELASQKADNAKKANA